MASSSNRLRVTSVKEVTLGTTPTTPRMRTRRLTGESLKAVPVYEEPNELRDDGMTGDETKVATDSNGGVDFEMIYPFPNTPEATDIESAYGNTWVNTPSRDNDGTADSIITGIATTNEVLTVTTGDAFVAGQLARFTDFGVALNNGVFKVTTGSATVPRFIGAGLTDEAAPPAAARVKVVGFQGAAADITATATGLGSTALDFTTLGLAVGMWIDVGGTAAGDKFATAALNAVMRITAIAATALTLDNRPTGWTTDAGTGKTIKVWIPDYIKNGTTVIGQTFERGHMGQTAPTYFAQPGMVAGQYETMFEKRRKIKHRATYLGMGFSAPSTTSLDASPDAAPTIAAYPVFACGANVGRVGEAGATLTSPNSVNGLSISVNSNITGDESIVSLGPEGITRHECQVTGRMDTFFGDTTLLDKFHAGTATALNVRATKGSQQLVWDLPRIVYNGEGSPNAGGKNQTMMLPLGFRASKDETLTNAMILLHRFEYVE